MQAQSRSALAGGIRSEDKRAIVEIRRYLEAFLSSPDGAFYVSQDADLKPGEHSTEYFKLDDAGRRAQGVPHVDRHLYAMQNGQIIEALATWAEFGGDNEALATARHAAGLDHRPSRPPRAAFAMTTRPQDRISATRWRWVVHSWRCIAPVRIVPG